MFSRIVQPKIKSVHLDEIFLMTRGSTRMASEEPCNVPALLFATTPRRCLPKLLPKPAGSKVKARRLLRKSGCLPSLCSCPVKLPLEQHRQSSPRLQPPVVFPPRADLPPPSSSVLRAPSDWLWPPPTLWGCERNCALGSVRPLFFKHPLCAAGAQMCAGAAP